MTGKEIAIYSGNSIEQWNLFGLDQVGDIKSNGDKFFYLKDHLGSIRAILDSTNTVVVANDYDCWGYPLEYRSYEPVNQRYKFTGKERDHESASDGNGYDYFGARYYDSRIGRWGGVDPSISKLPSINPYNYSVNNPLMLIDPNGIFPYTFIIRSFAPPGSFEPTGFRDDQRGFSTSLDVTSRIKQSFTIDPSAKTYSGGNPTSDPTILSGISKTAQDIGGISSPEFSINEFGSAMSTLTSEFSGSNPFFYGLAPNIEVSSAISLTENLDQGMLYISMDLMSKSFPATESLIQDKNGNIIFLSGSPAVGSAVDLMTNLRKTVGKVDLIININKEGVFQDVNLNGKTYTIEEFNNMWTNQNPGP